MSSQANITIPESKEFRGLLKKNQKNIKDLTKEYESKLTINII